MPGYTAPVGAPIWIDLTSSDVDEAVEFYTNVFGWTADPPNEDFGGYRNFRWNGELVAGLMRASEDGSAGPTDVWSVYLRTDDADATLSAATGAGGTVVVPGMDVGDLGRMGFVVDSAGAAVGVWQPGSHRGFATRGEPGTPYWFDCMSQNYESSLTFYRDVFGWKYQEVGTGGDPNVAGPDRYSLALFGDGDETEGLGGVMDAKGVFPDGVPSFWQVYITVADTDNAAAQIQEFGGEIIRPAEVTQWGTMGTAKDINGAVFLFATPPAGM
jgi:predicted enzyme related to lactoylglutathione lyase